MSSALDPALEMLHRALEGDRGALSFLDRTSSIYVLDVTDPEKPKTYGGWNFVHQAMTELERQERRETPIPISLHNHVQLLASISQRVARRPPSSDRYLVSLCIDNAALYHPTAKESQHLIEQNSELREIVMGRVAALVFDFSFHNPNGPHLSSFADPIAMESFCAALAANAVSSGPEAIKEFLVEWIIPSIATLPPFAVACLVLHVGCEATGKSAPAGTRNMLQLLSNPVMAILLAPILRDSILEIAETRDEQPSHERHSRVAASTIRAIRSWCTATELTLPQIKHVVGKVQINFVALISDAMYSDSNLVVEAMAELVEIGLDKTDKEATRDRMTQARFIMNVDEVAFQSISPTDLLRIESTEMDSIVVELVSAIGLQRYRFVERQAMGDNVICRCLARIAVSVCQSAMDALASGQLLGFASGMVDLLMKAAEHPSVHICALALEALAKLIPLDTNFGKGLLPLLQRRAIIPHSIVDGQPSLLANDTCGVDYHEFENFRQTVLCDSLAACFRDNENNYSQSCTTAVEEFCSIEPTVDVSFQMEAALFCLANTSTEFFLDGQDNGPSKPLTSRLRRITELLGEKPVCVMSSPLTLAQMCSFVRKYGKWYSTIGDSMLISTVADLCLTTFALSASEFSSDAPVHRLICDMASSPFSEAAKALGVLISESPQFFATQSKLHVLRECWATSYQISNRPELVSVEDRESLCEGFCHVVASLPVKDREAAYLTFSSLTLACFESMTKLADETVSTPSKNHGSSLVSILLRVADELRILSVFVSRPTKSAKQLVHEFEETDINPRLAILKLAWPSVLHIAEAFNSDEDVSNAFEVFLCSCASLVAVESGRPLLNEVCTLASSILSNSDGSSSSLHPVSELIENLVCVHGDVIEQSVAALFNPKTDHMASVFQEELVRMLESLIVSLIARIRSSLGMTWTHTTEQDNGQQPFESKELRPPEDMSSPSGEGLSEILTIFSACALRAPLLLCHISVDNSEESMMGPAVDSAVSVLLDPDVQTSLSAVHFLIAMMELWKSTPIDRVRNRSGRALSRVRRTMLSTLFAGVCGAMHMAVLEHAAELYYSVVRAFAEEEAIKFCAEDIQQEGFLLGDTAGSLFLQVVSSCIEGRSDVATLSRLFVDVWTLHQVDDTGFVAGSDPVLRFVQHYTSSASPGYCQSIGSF